MATSSQPSGSSAAPSPFAWAGVWRAAAGAPAVAGSLLLLVLLFGWSGRWEALIVLAWAVSAVVVLTGPGERIAVRVSCGFRRPSSAQTAILAPLLSAAQQQTATAADDVDLYVQRCRNANAYAAGGRSVAVTTGVLREYSARRLTQEQLVAVLVHELGHHAACSTRWALASAWLAGPWRLATRLFGRVICAPGVRQPRPLLAVVACSGVVVAVLQALWQRNWIIAGTFAGVAVLAVICPLTDAALSRRGELAADRFAADHGMASPLVAALRAMGGGCSSSVRRRLLASHPLLDQRIDALEAAGRLAGRRPRVDLEQLQRGPCGKAIHESRSNNQCQVKELHR